MQTGYSGKPLIAKLGISKSTKLLLLNAPPDYFEILGEDITLQLCKGDERPDMVHLFVKNEEDFENQMEILESCLHPHISIWVSWYKKSSGIATDVTEDSIRAYAISHNLVDIKVCAVNDKWSGLKLVVPLRKR
jgi:hypothetical protein